MLTLFRSLQNHSVGTMHVPQWPYIVRGFTKNVDKAINFYRLYTIGIKSDHFLIRLLQSINVSMDLPLERYYANVEAKALTLSMILGMTSSIYKGRLHKSIFYGTKNPEILLAVDEYFDIDEADKNWENVTAVVPLLHPKSDLTILLPNGKETSPEYGLSVIKINITMLAIQYRAFCRAQSNNTYNPQKTIMQFIGGFVLPNMLKQQTEICLFNRINRAFYQIETDDNIARLKHPFAVTNYTHHIDNAINTTLSNMTKVPQRFDLLLRMMPSFYSDNLYESLIMPDIMPTRQVDWVLVVSRLKVFNLLIDISGDAVNAENQIYLNQAMRALSMYDTYAVFRDMLPDDIFFEQQGYVQNLLDASDRISFR